MTLTVKRILLVEDSDRDAELIMDALDQHGLINDVVRVRDGEAALDYLYRRGQFAGRSDEDPAMVLLDLKMPKVNGLEVLQQVRNDGQTKRIPIVIMTSSRDDRDLAKAYELGVNAYVVKPVNFSAFVNAVQQVGVFWALINEPPPQRDRDFASSPLDFSKENG
jgi:CheY-like chemotaxis protein